MKCSFADDTPNEQELLSSAMETSTITPDSIRLDGRVAVVTGAAQGIGAATALALARFGCDVAICDRDERQLADVANEIRLMGRSCVADVIDVRDGDAVRAHLARVASEFGRVDVLVNNAGGGFMADFLDVNDKGQEALIRENFTSVTNFIRGCDALFPATGASVVTMTSIEAHRAAPGFAIYAAMKTALMSLSKTLALELGSRNIRTNCIAMDVIPTPGIGVDMGTHTPLPMRAHTDDVVGAVVYLASDWARFVTGTTIHIDGGNLAASGWIRQADGTFGTSVRVDGDPLVQG
jgi:NAD(P)-dependent dehydrogenase (short-subunit alcohol dehydrogenase family)